MKSTSMLKGLAMLAILAGLGLAARQAGLADMFDSAWIDENIRGRGLSGEIIFLALATAVTAVGLPRQIVAFAGGYAFGLLEGTALALAGTAMGCIIGFSYARFLGRDAVARRFPDKVRRIDRFLGENPFSTTLAIRLLPAGSNLLTNLAAGVSSVPLTPFVLGSAVGYVPQTVIFALAGTGVAVDPGLRIGLSVALFVIAAALGAALYRRYRRRRGVDPVDADDTAAA